MNVTGDVTPNDDVLTLGANNTVGIVDALAGNDKITDFNTGGYDIIDSTVSLTIDAALGAAINGTASIDAEGFATFDAANTSLSSQILAVEAAIALNTTVAGEFSLFVNGGNTYLFISDGVNGVTANDHLIELTNVAGLSTTTISGGGDLTIA